MNAARSIVAIAGAVVLTLAACDEKKNEAERNAVQANPQGAVDRALGAPGNTSAAVQAGKEALVAQQCAIRCQAKPGIDPAGCTARCTKACAAEKDTAGMDTCAVRTAEQSPKMN
jgi:hypothetical protein